MNIVIKNVTDDPVNDGLILELRKSGYPAGSIILDVVYSEQSKSCRWSNTGNDCVAYLGKTCIELPQVSNLAQPLKNLNP